MLRSEIRARLGSTQLENTKEWLFGDFQMEDDNKENIITSLYSGHHLLILGPPGSGKTVLGERICRILGNMEVIKDCPVNCHPQSPSCPWCIGRDNEPETASETVPGDQRVKRVQGSPELLPEDLIGALDPEAALLYGLHDIRTFIPGKLLKSNRGFLLLDFIDRIPERVLNVILSGLEDSINIGGYEERVPLDTLIIATGGEKALKSLPIDMRDYFDVVHLPYLKDSEIEGRIVFEGKDLDERLKEKTMNIVHKTRDHPDVKRGVSTRGGIKFAELLPVYRRISSKEDAEIVRSASVVSLPHRIALAPHAESIRSPEEIIEEIVEDVLLGGDRKKYGVVLTEEEVKNLVEEIVRVERFKHPLKMGYFDLLLKRIHRFPDSQLAGIHKKMVEKLDEDIQSGSKNDMSESLLLEIEEMRKHEEKMFEEYKKMLEKMALKETLDSLERRNVLEKSEKGWNLTRKAVTMLLEKLVPKYWDYYNSSAEGRHKTGKRLNFGEGRIIGQRKYRFGDRYRDVSIKDTIRETIRNRRDYVTREDIIVFKKDIRKKLEIVLIIDLSGTMSQLDKLWYAKESAMALSLACTQYKDRVGVVTFSNMADILVDITGNPYVVAEKVLDLDLHENAFTNIGFGLSKARSLLTRHKRGEVKQHIVLISDGDANAPKPFPEKYCIEEAAKTIRKGITISCVCINEKSANPLLMSQISRIGKGRIYMIGGTEELTPVLLEERAQV
ncbi:MAG: VWA domain-containing protein [Thermodesulfobacteriota bacterium]|nr:VWA domain-containing protein [Thermodesulfobacteriota bacterium]